MTIRPGQDWGREVAVPPGLATAASDAELAAWLAAGRAGRVLDGDLAATVGGPSGASCREYPVDVATVTVDGGAPTSAVAHVVIRRPGRWGWWRGPLVAVMNVSGRGRWDVAPRAHPNDGRLDVVEVAATMSIRDRWAARRRLPTGTHVPHPAITIRRASAYAGSFARPMLVEADGVAVGRGRDVRVELTPDGGTFFV